MRKNSFKTKYGKDMTTSSMDALKASQMTPQAITTSSKTPEEIYMILRSATKDHKEKLQALVRRSDVIDATAYQLLKSVFEGYHQHGRMNFFQSTMLSLYINKFVKRGKQRDSIQCVLMMIVIWIDFMGDLLKGIAPRDSKTVFPQLRIMVLALVKRHTPYQLSVKTLLKEIEDQSDTYTDRYPSSHYSLIYNFDQYVFPLIGEILVDLTTEGLYFQSTENLHELATKQYFGDKDRIGPLYIKSIENSFTLENIQPFIPWRETGTMEQFLLSEGGAIAKTHFQTLCENTPTEAVLALLHNGVRFADFHLSQNKAYAAISLEAKADFIKPYSSALELNNREVQEALLRVWVTDSEWMNPERSISELVHLALKKRHIFSGNAGGVFYDMMRKILSRIHHIDYLETTEKHGRFLHILYWALKDGTFIRDEWYPEDFPPILILITLDRVDTKYREHALDKKEIPWAFTALSRNIHERLITAFIELVGTCLKDFKTVDACEMVHQAKGWNNETVITTLMQRTDLTFKQVSDLLLKTKYDQFNSTLTPAVILLYSGLLKLVRDKKSPKDAARMILFVLARHHCSLHRETHTVFLAIFERPVFKNLSKLMPIVKEFVGHEKITYKDFPELYISKDFITVISAKIEKFIEQENKSKEEALVFCQDSFFEKDYLVWKWFYGRYPLDTLNDLRLSQLDEKSIGSIFTDYQHKTMRAGLEAAWANTPLKEIAPDMLKFLIGYRYLVSYDKHPDWIAMSLKERLTFFRDDNKGDYDFLLKALGQDFDRIWKEGNWTVDMWLEEIERIDPHNPEPFAALAVSFA